MNYYLNTPISDVILGIAAGPMPTVVKALDAIHLATAVTVRDALWPQLVFATHDRQLANAAQATGFAIDGI